MKILKRLFGWLPDYQKPNPQPDVSLSLSDSEIECISDVVECSSEEPSSSDQLTQQEEYELAKIPYIDSVSFKDVYDGDRTFHFPPALCSIIEREIAKESEEDKILRYHALDEDLSPLIANYNLKPLDYFELDQKTNPNEVTIGDDGFMTDDHQYVTLIFYSPKGSDKKLARGLSFRDVKLKTANGIQLLKFSVGYINTLISFYQDQAWKKKD